MNRSIYNRLIFLLILLSGTVASISQNPFDIKKPAAGAPVPAVKKTNPVKKPTTKTTTEVGTAARNTDSLAGKALILTESTAVTTTVTPPKDTESKISAPTPTSTQASSGLDQGNNPFNIKPPVGAAPPTVVNTTPATTPTTDPGSVSKGVTEIKEKVNNFKKATTTDGRKISKNAWFVVYIFLFLMAAIAINFNRSYPVSLIKATYNQNQLRALFKDAFKGNHMMIFGILYFIFIVNAGIFTYLSFKSFEVAPLSLFMAILMVLAVYLVRHLVMLILAQVFPLEKEASFFSFTIGIHNLALGLALMLINICLSFVDEESGKILIFSGLSLILLLYALRQIRGLLNNIPTIASGKFHFIIYLCTVEIAPWILLAGIILK